MVSFGAGYKIFDKKTGAFRFLSTDIKEAMRLFECAVISLYMFSPNYIRVE
jgi:hypothetical protein